MYIFLYEAQVELFEHFLSSLILDVFACAAHIYDACLH